MLIVCANRSFICSLLKVTTFDRQDKLYILFGIELELLMVIRWSQERKRLWTAYLCTPGSTPQLLIRLPWSDHSTYLPQLNQECQNWAWTKTLRAPRVPVLRQRTETTLKSHSTICSSIMIKTHTCILQSTETQSSDRTAYPKPPGLMGQAWEIELAGNVRLHLSEDLH